MRKCRDNNSQCSGASIFPQKELRSTPRSRVNTSLGNVLVLPVTKPLPQGFNCRPETCIGVAGAMSANRVACTVVWSIVRQHQLHGQGISIKATRVRGSNTTEAM